jgi:hypothetical protein
MIYLSKKIYKNELFRIIGVENPDYEPLKISDLQSSQSTNRTDLNQSQASLQQSQHSVKSVRS